MSKRSLLLLLLFALTACVTTGKKVDFVRDMDGFRGYKWGIPVEEVGSTLVSRGEDEGRDIEWFTRKDDPLKLGDANLQSVTYVFREGRFAAVSIIAKGLSNYKALLVELDERLGKTEPITEDSFVWDLEHTSVLFSYNRQSEVAMLVIRPKE